MKKKLGYLRQRQKDSQTSANDSTNPVVTKCHEDFAYAYRVVADIIESDAAT